MCAFFVKNDTCSEKILHDEIVMMKLLFFTLRSNLVHSRHTETKEALIICDKITHQFKKSVNGNVTTIHMLHGDYNATLNCTYDPLTCTFLVKIYMKS